MAEQVPKISELEAESPQENREQAAAAIGVALVYLGHEAVEAGLIEVAHLIGVATRAAFETADGQWRRRVG